jgi:drug/metabolite transporter (DMT)-like permease
VSSPSGVSASAVAAGRPRAFDLKAGIGFTLVMTSVFSVGDTSVKYLGPTFPIVLLLAVRYLVQLVSMLALKGALAYRQRSFRTLFATRNLRFQLLRAALLLSNSALGFSALMFMPVGEFTALVMLSPLFATLLAKTVLHENVSRQRWALVAIGFIGVLLVVRPGTGMLGWPTLIPLSMALLFSAFQLVTSRMAAIEDPYTTHFYTGLFSTLVMALALSIGYDEVLLTISRAAPVHFGVLLLAGICGSFGHMFLILAYARAPLSLLQTFTYSQIGFAVLLGWLVFEQVPDVWAALGMIVIAISGAATLWLTQREAARRNVPVTPLTIDTHFD